MLFILQIKKQKQKQRISKTNKQKTQQGPERVNALPKVQVLLSGILKMEIHIFYLSCILSTISYFLYYMLCMQNLR